MSIDIKIKLPENVALAIEKLEKAGYEAFVVGGAVRDSLMGNNASDFDITTSAFPLETERVFEGYKVIETGIKHGTVTVIIDNCPIEITTYRIDGEYLDNRHPLEVSFTRNVLEDLSRRDFTINAMAYNPKIGLLDPFSGLSDLENKIVRCVGDPTVRFNEDALRILRCVRFASCLGFAVEEKTGESVKNLAHLLLNVSAERIFSELKRFLCGADAGKIMMDFPEVITTIVPELSLSVGFHQKSKYHIYNVYEHTARAIEASESNLLVRLSLLYHDCGKPYVFTVDEKGYRHFLGHQKESAVLAKASLERLKCDTKTRETVEKLVLFHDYPIVSTRKSIKKLLSKVSFDEAILIVKIKYADMSSHHPTYAMSVEDRDEYIRLIKEMECVGECVSVKDLNVSGLDLMNIGIPQGREMGIIINELFSLVVEEEIPNIKEILLEKANELYSKMQV